MQLGSSPVDPESLEIKVRQRERELLHLPIDRTALSSLAVWDPQTNFLRKALVDEIVDGEASLTVIHLWATWCTPCVEDFPIWRELKRDVRLDVSRRVRILHVALQRDSSSMANFVESLGARHPASIWYFDRDERLAGQLRPAFNNQAPSLPLTILLDKRRIVRQAFFGPIKDRRKELTDSMMRLLRLIEWQDMESSEQTTRTALPTAPTSNATVPEGTPAALTTPAQIPQLPPSVSHDSASAAPISLSSTRTDGRPIYKRAWFRGLMSGLGVGIGVGIGVGVGVALTAAPSGTRDLRWVPIM